MGENSPNLVTLPPSLRFGLVYRTVASSPENAPNPFTLTATIVIAIISKIERLSGPSWGANPGSFDLVYFLIPSFYH
jgi:hypothetical protein